MQVDGAKGLLFCGTGMGVGIVANRFSGIQAATCENVGGARERSTIATCCASVVRSRRPPTPAPSATRGSQEHGKPPSDPPPGGGPATSSPRPSLTRTSGPLRHKVEDAGESERAAGVVIAPTPARAACAVHAIVAMNH